VNGTADVTFTASSELISIVNQAKQVIQLAGQLNSNGPGSTGRSSPDAAAPAPWPTLRAAPFKSYNASAS
jgi:hypothetical protein